MKKDTGNEYMRKTASADKWDKVGLNKRSGILVPLFSVYSRDSLGIGEFPDLKLIIDWAVETGNSIIQLLPMNELGAFSCPYDSISSFALEPAYLSLGLIPGAKKQSIAENIQKTRDAFPAGKMYIDYSIKNEKLRLLREIFLESADSLTAELDRFKKENSYWLDDFVKFKAIKNAQDNRPWYEWEENFRDRDKGALDDFCRQNQKELLFWVWVQYFTFRQFQAARKYAHEKGVLLKGDLPILVSRDSADVWAHRDFFKLDCAAGAPPDMYCAKGQRWGMPTYNWESIVDDGYKYLQEKLKFAGNFYDILRIDHVVGLFRIWSIPYNDPQENQGLNGFFDPRDESQWGSHGRDILSVMLKNTDMLLCAEDLGVIPKACTDTLKELGIPGNDVQRWVKDWNVKHDFLQPKEYRGLAVAMLSTHDTTNWPAWWENEAGTVDEGLFARKCCDSRQINVSQARVLLFDTARSHHGRLRWLNSVNSVDSLASALGKRKDELVDFIDMYMNTYQEKEKLWRHLRIKGPMREGSDAAIAKAALKISLESEAVFCINTVIDWLYLAGVFSGDPYQYRINTPGTISQENWALTLPLGLEDLLKHKINKTIKQMIVSSDRI